MSVEPERRGQDRRRGERRHPPRPAPDDSWLGAWGRPAEPLGGGPGAAAGLPSDAGPESGSDSTFIAREAKRLVSNQIFYKLADFINTFVINGIENEFSITFCVHNTCFS